MCQGSPSSGSSAFNSAFNGGAMQKAGAGIGSGYNSFGQASPYGQPFSYAPGSSQPQAHQFFEGTQPGGTPTPVTPGTPPPTTYTPPPGAANPPGNPTFPPPTDTGVRPPSGGPILPPPLTTPSNPGQGANPPGTLPPSNGSAPPPNMPPPNVPPPNTGVTPGLGSRTKIGFGEPLADYFGERAGLGDRNVFMDSATAPSTPSPAAPAANPLLAAIYSGQGGAFTPQQINSAGPLGSNKWNPAATSIAGSQAGFNIPAPMFQAGHLANGNAVMQNGQFTWTPQGLATMQANSGMKK